MPVDTTLETALPEMVPNNDEAMIAIFAAPPRYCPKAAIARSVKNAAPPDRPSSAPKNRNETTTVEAEVRVVVRILFVVAHRRYEDRREEWRGGRLMIYEAHSRDNDEAPRIVSGPKNPMLRSLRNPPEKLLQHRGYC